MTDLDRLRHERAMKRLNDAIYRADLAATPSEHLQLIAVKHAVRAGHITLADALAAVNHLRATRREARVPPERRFF